ncbi:MAG: FixH family protein [Deltaproteobacteria bacterium]|nr:FixH family protein [Deltaproteobacteria bacterium]
MTQGRSPFSLVRILTLTVVGALALGACGSDETSSSGSSGTQGQTACERDTRKDVYTAGLVRQGGAISVKIVESTPAPPKKLQNVLEVLVTDAAGKPLEKAAITVTPFMPDHAHGSNVVPVVTEKGGGAYTIDKIYLPMAGLWTLTLSITPPGAAAPQDVVFKFCLDG